MKRTEQLVAWLKQSIAQKDWSPADFARASGMNEATVSRVLKGTGKDISRATVEAICSTFGVSEIELYSIAHGAGESVASMGAGELEDRFTGLGSWLRDQPPHVQEPFFKLAEGFGWEGE